MCVHGSVCFQFVTVSALQRAAVCVCVLRENSERQMGKTHTHRHMLLLCCVVDVKSKPERQAYAANRFGQYAT